MGTLNNCITIVCNKNYVLLNIIAFIAAFVCYFSMYAYRKSFSASKFEGYELWKTHYKIMGLTFQSVGYTISKFAGIKFISELNNKYRGILIISLIAAAEVTLILLGAIPPPYNSLMMLLNGLPLGMIWGLVFSYLEGRQTSEILGSGMAVSFIVSSGAIKSVGQEIMNAGVNQFWMPATVGAIFFIPLVISVFFLESVPDPNERDIATRTERVSMTHIDRIDFCKIFGPGVLFMTMFYMCLTAYRDFRDNFAPELWEAFGYDDTPSIFTTSEIIVAVCVVIPIACFMFIKRRIYSFVAYYILIVSGQILLLICTIIIDKDKMKGLYFMIISGVGLYVGYVPFNSIIYDLLLAVFQYKANSGFLMYICDSFGYLCSIAILFVKNFANANLSWLQFFIYISYAMSIAGSVLIVLDFIYYIIKYKIWTQNASNMDSNEDINKEKEDFCIKEDGSLKSDDSDSIGTSSIRI